MIFGYFDESGESGEGFFVVAGFVGRRKDWTSFLASWEKVLGDSSTLHLKEMRLGSRTAPKKHQDLLRRLGSVPKRSNLHAFAGSVRTSDYSDKIKGTIASIGMAGYSVALVAMVDAVLESKHLSKRDRIEFTFEQQLEFATQRAMTFRSFRQVEKYMTHHGKSRIGRDITMAKSPILEASDYLAYAILQQLLDPNSQKAQLTSPILQASGPIAHTEITKDNADYLLQSVFPEKRGGIPKMDRDKKAFILERMNKASNT